MQMKDGGVEEADDHDDEDLAEASTVTKYATQAMACPYDPNSDIASEVCAALSGDPTSNDSFCQGPLTDFGEFTGQVSLQADLPGTAPGVVQDKRTHPALRTPVDFAAATKAYNATRRATLATVCYSAPATPQATLSSTASHSALEVVPLPNMASLAADPHLLTPQPYLKLDRPPTLDETTTLFKLSTNQELTFKVITTALTGSVEHQQRLACNPAARITEPEQLYAATIGDAGAGKSQVVHAFLWHAWQHKINDRVGICAPQWRAALQASLVDMHGRHL
jgi:hypothetical protein